MKKIYKNFAVASIFVISILQVQATNHVVTVADFTFNPNNLTVSTGDTITWMWMSGSHTTTSTTIPAGADAWNQPLNNNSVSFSYVVQAAGLYSYICVPHQSMGMTGQFTAVNPSGIPLNSSIPFVSIDGNLTSTELKLNYYLENSQLLTVGIYDIIGKPVKTIYLGMQPAGPNEKLLNVSGIPKGLYLVKLDGKEISLTRKIVIQ